MHQTLEERCNDPRTSDQQAISADAKRNHSPSKSFYVTHLTRRRQKEETVHKKTNNLRDGTLHRNVPLEFYKTENVRGKQHVVFDKRLVAWLPLGMLTLCVCVPPYLPHFSSPPLLLHLRVLSPFLFSPISVPFNHFTSEIRRGHSLS